MSKTTREQYNEAYRLLRINAKHPGKCRMNEAKLDKMDEDAAWNALVSRRNLKDFFVTMRLSSSLRRSWLNMGGHTVSPTGREFFNRKGE